MEQFLEGGFNLEAITYQVRTSQPWQASSQCEFTVCVLGVSSVRSYKAAMEQFLEGDSTWTPSHTR
jgi:hypothetical protein